MSQGLKFFSLKKKKKLYKTLEKKSEGYSVLRRKLSFNQLAHWEGNDQRRGKYVVQKILLKIDSNYTPQRKGFSIWLGVRR